MPFYHGLKPKFRDILWQDLFVWKNEKIVIASSHSSAKV